MSNSERRTRPDRAKAAIVYEGVIMADQYDRVVAASFLNRHHVPFSVIVRVLADPERRRRPAAHPPPDCRSHTGFEPGDPSDGLR